MPIIDGHEIAITNPQKVLFPDDGITKGDLVEYYRRIADRMIPQVRDRPLHMNRFPDGIGRIVIQQKRIPDSFPQWIKRATVDLHRGGHHHPRPNRQCCDARLPRELQHDHRARLALAHRGS